VLLTRAVFDISELLHLVVNLGTRWHGRNPQKTLGFKSICKHKMAAILNFAATLENDYFYSFSKSHIHVH